MWRPGARYPPTEHTRRLDLPARAVQKELAGMLGPGRQVPRWQKQLVRRVREVQELLPGFRPEWARLPQWGPQAGAAGWGALSQQPPPPRLQRAQPQKLLVVAQPGLWLGETWTAVGAAQPWALPLAGLRLQ